MARFDDDVVIIGSASGEASPLSRTAEKGLYRPGVIESGKRWTITALSEHAVSNRPTGARNGRQRQDEDG